MLLDSHAPAGRAAPITVLLLTLTVPLAAGAQISNWTAHAGIWNLDGMGDIRQTAQDPATGLGFGGTPANILQRNGLVLGDFSVCQWADCFWPTRQSRRLHPSARCFLQIEAGSQRINFYRTVV